MDIKKLIWLQFIALEVCFDDEENCHTYKELENITYLCEYSSTKRPNILRLENYVEQIIPLYSNELFKSHFRYVMIFL